MRDAGTANTVYRILDEPQPGAFARLVVNPFWVILTLMLGGGWIGWPWFVVNALALGSGHKLREIALVLASFAFAFSFTSGVLYAMFSDLIGVTHARYLMIAVPAAKMAFGFAVFRMQERSFALYEHFGGHDRRAAMVVLLLGIAGRVTLLRSAGTFWGVVLG